jgi:predicted kinase
MTTLTITRGLPGSGKTTLARGWVADDPETRTRVNRDDLRMTVYGVHTGLSYAQEQTITTAQHAAVRALLVNGRDVIVDDTNLRLRNARAWADLAVEVGADLHVWDIETAPDECVRRDAARDRVVGPAVIHGMAARFRFPLPPVLPSERSAATPPRTYEANLSLPSAWLVDIDGTLAHMGDRSPYDTTRVIEDASDPTVVDLVGALRADGHAIVVMSGRDDECRADTEKWLDVHLGYYDALHMRTHLDRRADYLVKADLFDANVRDQWSVIGVLDDRAQVVKMWRSMGLTCLQVADGDF